METNLEILYRYVPVAVIIRGDELWRIELDGAPINITKFYTTAREAWDAIELMIAQVDSEVPRGFTVKGVVR